MRATPREQANNRATTIHVTIAGVTKPLAEWCEEFGVKRASAWLRYKAGLRGEALFQTRWQLITHNGITDTVSGWSKRTGIKPTTIVMRLKRQWPAAKALTEGVIRCAS